MLDRLYASLPEKTKKHERFQLPEADSFQQGNKTIVKNFTPIVKALNRDIGHATKYLAKETATNAIIDETGRLVLNGRFSNRQINDLIKSYINQFVICPECKRPDTNITEKQGIKMLHCEACGAISAVKGL